MKKGLKKKIKLINMTTRMLFSSDIRSNLQKCTCVYFHHKIHGVLYLKCLKFTRCSTIGKRRLMKTLVLKIFFSLKNLIEFALCVVTST